MTIDIWNGIVYCENIARAKAELFLTRYGEGCLFFNSARYISRPDFVEKLPLSVDFWLVLSNEEISFSAS